MAPRKKGVTKTPQKVKQWIYEEALEKHSTPSELLAIRVRKSLVDEGLIAEDGSPDKDTIINYIQEARRKDPVDQPWSLGLSHSFNIPCEANGDLLGIWKQSVLVGEPLSIREAQWAARLRGVRPLPKLPLIAGNYALRERVCKALRIDMETKDLDAELAFGNEDGCDWGYGACVATGLFVEPHLVRNKERQMERENVETDSVGLFPAKRRISGDWLTELIMREPPGVIHELYVTLGTEFLPLEVDEVYCLWLQRLMKGPGWNDSTDPDRMTVGSQLLHEVIEGSKRLDTLRCEERASEDEWKAGNYASYSWDKHREVTEFKMAWHPSLELLAKVGYTSDDCHSRGFGDENS